MHDANFLKPDLGNTCFATVHPRTNYIPAHEVTHHLWAAEHVGFTWNLMYGTLPTEYNPHGKDPRANKRLTQDQVTIMRQHEKLQ